MLLDTTFLIHLEREIRTGREERAHRFLRTLPQVQTLSISVITVGEFAAGYDEARRKDCLFALRRYRILDLGREIALRYGGLHDHLRRVNRLIGDNDLWIAATARQHGLPLVTDNTGHFNRVPGIKIISY